MSGDPDEAVSKHDHGAVQGEGVTPVLDAKIQEQLGLALSQYTKELLDQPIPESFLALLAELEAREPKA
jgi:hypothetical protein